MRKWIQLIAMSLAVIMLAGCNLIATDTELDAKMTVLQVGDQIITKSELANTWSNAMNQLSYTYQLYGLQFDASSETYRQQALEQAIDSVVSYHVVQQKGKALGLDQFTEEELAALDPEVQEEMDYYASLVKSEFFADSALEGDELTEAVDAKMAELDITREKMLESVQKEKIAERVREHAIRDVVVTDEEVSADYQTKMTAQKDSYAANITAYASDLMNNQTIYYVPAGYRYVKHVLIKIDSEAQSAISALESELTTLRTTQTNLQDSLAELEPAEPEAAADADATPAPTEAPLTEEETAARAESAAQLTEQLTQTAASIAAKEAELEKAKADAFAAIQPKAQQVHGEIAQGLDFDEAIETYGEDTGMTTEPFKTQGYPVIDGLSVYDAAFQAASMALGQVGDVSEPVQSTFGYHIIKYVGDSAEHEIGLDAVSAGLNESLLTTKQDNTYNEALEQWISDTKVKRYDDRMDFI